LVGVDESACHVLAPRGVVGDDEPDTFEKTRPAAEFRRR
jgi:hypothetical protein